MSGTADSQGRAKVWLKPDQVERMRTAAYDGGHEYLQQRDETIVAVLADTGLRVGELVALRTEYLRERNAKLYLPSEIQKDYPTDDSPPPTTMGLSPDIQRLLSSYLTNRWKESPFLFPSRVSEQMTTEAVRNVVGRLADRAEVRPFLVDGTRGEPEDVTPHALRHSLAYRMLNHEDGHTFYDVRNRLRHRSIQTTERVYDHIDEV